MIVCTETVFTLHTTHTSYQLAVAPNGMVLHTYYGTRLPEDVPSLADARMPHSDPGCWPDLLPQELSGCGTADNRTPAVIPEYADGTEAAAFVFDHAVVTPGKPQLPGLPMFRTGEGVETLSVFLKDAGGLVVELRYSVYEAEDLITRTAGRFVGIGMAEGDCRVVGVAGDAPHTANALDAAAQRRTF